MTDARSPIYKDVTAIVTILFAIYGFYGFWVFIFTTESTLTQDVESYKELCLKSGEMWDPTENLCNHMVIKQISILTEKKECEEKGGEFQIWGNYRITENADKYNIWLKYELGKDYTLTCTSPSKVISEVRI